MAMNRVRARVPIVLDPRTGIRGPAIVGKIVDTYIPPEHRSQLASLFSSEGKWTLLMGD